MGDWRQAGGGPEKPRGGKSRTASRRLSRWMRSYCLSKGWLHTKERSPRVSSEAKPKDELLESRKPHMMFRHG